MNRILHQAIAVGVFAISLHVSPAAFAQLDRVYPTQGPVVSGSIIQTQPDGVVIQVGGAERKFTLDKIDRVVFDREPGPLTEGRSLVRQEQYEAALTQLGQINMAQISRAEIKADAMFYRAFSQAQVALAGQGNKNAAVKEMYGFVTSVGKNSFHFYDAAKTLGDLALAVGSYDNAVKYYGALARSSDANLQLQSRYLVGWSYLQQKKLDEADKAFAAVTSASVSSPDQLRYQKLALAGQAAIAAGKGDPDKGLESLNKLIEESDAADAELFGRLYNAQGACLAAKSDPEGAVLAYLKTHLLFPSDPDSHAEALAELVQLWPQVGHPERANEARTILQTRYPGRN
ncbi:tetratricopeptide repeat protein [Rosistilla oblonga]|uniref:Tetratricopeptide repeat protein n=1 Tax=Rosistilla oblonga TaxID=2527990 RepID=A0A518IPJ2_9BACT|nr:tetratricopeptide repeat protein [Rosistilla oblonga]QDV54992.1 Tetratricopeptide repeat protein [Rosistilla oblonga]